MVRELIVIKKPRSGPQVDRPINFPPLQNLHLEMMENKRKLKKGLPLIPIQKKPMKIEITVPVNDSHKDDKHHHHKHKDKHHHKEDKHHRKDDRHRHKEDKSDEDDGELDADVVAALGAVAEEKIKDDVVEKFSKEKKSVPQDTQKAKKEFSKDEKSSPNKSPRDTPPATPEDESVDESISDSDDESDSDTSSVDDDEEEKKEVKEEEDDPYAGLSPEEREVREKEEYIWRFRILKRKYKNHDIPDYNEHDDLASMKLAYDRKVRELYIDDSLESYWTYLVGGFMVMEFICTTMIGIDMKGFAAHQVKMKSKYEHLLIELGEKSYNRWGMNLPVEIRLISVVILNAGIFYLAKVIADRGGSAAADMFKAFTGQTIQQQKDSEKTPSTQNTSNGGQTTSGGPRKMKGPSINLDDIQVHSVAPSSGHTADTNKNDTSEHKQRSQSSGEGLRKRKDHEE